MVDASALVEALLLSPSGQKVLELMDSTEIAAPDLINLEVASVVRRLERHGGVSAARAAAMIDDLTNAPIRRFLTRDLLADIWTLRHNCSPYDAAYVALARALGCTVITTDRRLAQAPGIRPLVKLVS